MCRIARVRAQDFLCSCIKSNPFVLGFRFFLSIVSLGLIRWSAISDFVHLSCNLLTDSRFFGEWSLGTSGFIARYIMFSSMLICNSS